ncbi:J domain-containing protein [Clostridium sporogenes]|uniref:J domain-containing protein n=1 Tax=Clostridium sporogenes TaxID=1509 RepID=UPI002902FB95|nr:hypothetical protein [Clostridium botulinum]
MKSCWEVLDIEPYSDLKTIKKAYAKLLKIHHPEDDPKGYQDLREAYDKAQKLVKGQNKEALFKQVIFQDEFVKEIKSKEKKCEVDKLDLSPPPNENKLDFKETKEDNNTPSHSKTKKELTVDNLYNALWDIYNNMESRININSWENILSSELLWDLSKIQKIKEIFFVFIADNPFIPKNILNLIDKTFHYRDMELYLYKHYSEDIVERFFYVLKKPEILSYKYLLNIDNSKADKYLAYREFALLHINDVQIFDENSKKAYEIYKEDFELLKLMADKTIDNHNNEEEALKLYKEALKIEPDNAKIIYSVAYILYRKEHYKEALLYYKKIENTYKNEVKFLKSLALCYYYTENYEKSKEYLYTIKNLGHNNRIISKYLSSIPKLLNGKQLKLLPNLDLIEQKKTEDKYSKIQQKKFRKTKNKDYPKIIKIRNCLLLIIFIILVTANIVGIPSTYRESSRKPIKELKSYNEIKKHVNNPDEIKIMPSDIISTNIYLVSDYSTDSVTKQYMTKKDFNKLNNKQDYIIDAELYIVFIDNFAFTYLDFENKLSNLKNSKYIYGYIKNDNKVRSKIYNDFVSQYNLKYNKNYLFVNGIYIQ